MKEFDLQKAIAGHPLVTRDGRKVQEFHYFEKAVDSEYCFLAVIDGSLHTFTTSGRFDIAMDEGNNDLFLDTIKKTYWMNIYKNPEISAGLIFDRQEEAENHNDHVNYLKTISFEVEE